MASLISAREMSHDEDDDTNFLGSLGGWTGNFPQTQCLLMMYLHVAGISLVYVGDDFMYMAESYFFLYLIMSLPLGSRRIIFLGCLSIYPSTWLSICQSIHLTSAVLHRWQTDWLTVNPSAFPSIWRDFCMQIGLQYDMPMYPDHLNEIIRFWSWCADFPHFGII